MPNIKSAKKRVLVTEKKTLQNKAIKSALKTSIKKFLNAVNAGDKDTANALYPETVSAIDSAVTKGILHKNNANNKKAKLAKKLATLSE
ncbi:MAG: 30S ribosomal protein S20 [Clostridia bacterium]|nr:30S ribosomal protein S20 [Clostridia bacterium]